MFSYNQAELVTLVFSFLLPILCLLGLVASYLTLKQKKKTALRGGIEAVTYVSKLIRNLQQHRGLSYGCLRGDESLRNNLLSIESTIQSHIQTCPSDLFSTGTKERWDGFNNHWKRLLQNNLRTSPENNLEQHNLMIANLLFLMEDLIEVSGLVDIESPKFSGKISTTWLEILRTAEWTGQARALGTGIAASTHCSSVERIRIKFIRGKINYHSEVLRSAYKAISTSSQNRINEVFSNLENFTNTLDKRLIEPESPSVCASEYFNLATVSIDKLINLFDREISAYSGDLYESKRTKESSTNTFRASSTA